MPATGEERRARRLRRRARAGGVTRIDQRIVDAVAEAWASIDGKDALLIACRHEHVYEDRYGYADGYDSEARSLIERAARRGVVMSFEPPAIDPRDANPTWPNLTRVMRENGE